MKQYFRTCAACLSATAMLTAAASADVVQVMFEPPAVVSTVSGHSFNVMGFEISAGIHQYGGGTWFAGLLPAVWDHELHVAPSATGGAAFSAGDTIDASTPFEPVEIPPPVGPDYNLNAALGLGDESVWGTGPLAPGETGFAAFAVIDGANLYYGYIQYRNDGVYIAELNGWTWNLTLLGYAYETTPGAPITIANIPAPAGAMAAGVAVAFSSRRRRN